MSRLAVSFAEMDPIWDAIHGYMDDPDNGEKQGAVVDAIGVLRLAEREACAKLAESPAYGAARLAQAIRAHNLVFD